MLGRILVHSLWLTVPMMSRLVVVSMLIRPHHGSWTMTMSAVREGLVGVTLEDIAEDQGKKELRRE